MCEGLRGLSMVSVFIPFGHEPTRQNAGFDSIIQRLKVSGL